MNAEELKSLVISEKDDVRVAMDSLRKSGAGLAVVLDEEDRVVGVLSDGDIRKALLECENIHLPVTQCLNRDFISVQEGTSKERILKLLDTRIKVVPVLDAQGYLVDLIGSGYSERRNKPYVRAKAPARISLAGGGTDFTNYFMVHGGVCLSGTVSKYSHALLRQRSDRKIRIISRDLQQIIDYDNINHLVYDGKLDLIKAGIKLMRPDFGFDLEVGTDFPRSSGLGGSASLLAAVIGCFNQFQEDKLDNYRISELSFEAERIELNISGGWQDQYSTVFGGINFIEFNEYNNVVMPLRLEPSVLMELEERFVLCFTGNEHLGNAIQDQNHTQDTDNSRWSSIASELKDIATSMKTCLLRSRLGDIGPLLDETWRLKKDGSDIVTSSKLDAIYDMAKKSGAEGGRLLGTGGGGYFLFYVHPFHRYNFNRALENIGVRTEGVVFDAQGLRAWMSLL